MSTLLHIFNAFLHKTEGSTDHTYNNHGDKPYPVIEIVNLLPYENNDNMISMVWGDPQASREYWDAYFSGKDILG